VSDTSDHDQIRSSAAQAGGADGATAMGRASLESVDFDVTAGFGDEAPAADAEFIDLTQGSDTATAAGDEDFLDLGGEAAELPVPTVPVAGPPPVAPAPVPVAEAAGGGSKLALIGAIVAALVAAVLWFVMR